MLSIEPMKELWVYYKFFSLQDPFSRAYRREFSCMLASHFCLFNWTRERTPILVLSLREPRFVTRVSLDRFDVFTSSPRIRELPPLLSRVSTAREANILKQ